jgi:hypothetical protein
MNNSHNEKTQDEINKIRREDQELTSLIFHELYNALHVPRENNYEFKQKEQNYFSK